MAKFTKFTIAPVLVNGADGPGARVSGCSSS